MYWPRGGEVGLFTFRGKVRAGINVPVHGGYHVVVSAGIKCANARCNVVATLRAQGTSWAKIVLHIDDDQGGVRSVFWGISVVAHTFPV